MRKPHDTLLYTLVLSSQAAAAISMPIKSNEPNGDVVGIAAAAAAASTSRVAAAGSLRGFPPPIKMLVMLSTLPGAADDGIVTSTSNVQVAPGFRIPSRRVSTDVPAISEPGPQTSAIGNPTAAIPDRTASRSSENEI